jgi:hypothetical protein
VRKLNALSDRLQVFLDYDITMLLEDDYDGSLTAVDYVPDKETNKMKILCLQLADKDIYRYRELYEETPLYDVYELMTLTNAINYRIPKDNNERNEF